MMMRPIIWLLVSLLITSCDAVSKGIQNIAQAQSGGESLPKQHGQKTLSNDKRFIINVPSKTRTKTMSVDGLTRLRGGATLKESYDWYINECEMHPFRTKGITAGIICAVGDFIAQKLEKYLAKNEQLELQPRRMTSFFLCGMLYAGPFIHMWYKFLFEVGLSLGEKYGISKTQQALFALLTDQTIGVAVYYPLYFYFFELFESVMFGRIPSVARAHAKCLREIKDVCIMQYRIYPITNGINFFLIPPTLRVLFTNVISVFWNAYMCTKIAK